MGQNTKIEWTHRQRPDGSYIPGHTFNPWIGCEHKINEDGTPHPGCEHCYAEAFTNYTGKAKWGTLEEGGTRTKTSDRYWHEPLKWNAEAEDAGERQIVFCASFADVFEDWQGPIQMMVNKQHVHLGKSLRASAGERDRLTLDDLRVMLFEVIDATPWLDWLLLTKRPGNIRRMWPLTAVREDETEFRNVMRRDNVWLITSVSDQPTLDELWPLLAECRDLVPVLGLSAEPLVGPLQLAACLPNAKADPPATVKRALAAVDWVIVGGESGHHARLMHPDWARSIRDQCLEAGVPFFFKQWGEWRPKLPAIAGPVPARKGDNWGTLDRDGGWSPLTTPWNGRQDADSTEGEVVMVRVGKVAAGRSLDGMEWRRFPRASAEKT